MTRNKNVTACSLLCTAALALAVAGSASAAQALPIVHYSTSTITNGGCSGGDATTDRCLDSEAMLRCCPVGCDKLRADGYGVELYLGRATAVIERRERIGDWIQRIVALG